MVGPRSVVVQLPSLAPSHADVVLAAALALLVEGEHLAVSIADCEAITAHHGESLTSRLAELVDRPIRADVSLVTSHEVAASTPTLRVSAGTDPREAFLAVMQLAQFALTRPAPASDAREEGRAELHTRRDALIEQRRTRRAGAPARPLLAFVAQVQSTWGAADPVFRALEADGDVDLVVVTVPSEHEPATVQIDDYFTSLGMTVKDLSWLQAELEDETSALSAVVFYDPWDGLRPAPARASDVAAHGVPIVYLPYANSLGVGGEGEALPYDLPVHRLARAIFVMDDAQRDMFAQQCATGAADVVVTGSPKLDRLRPLRRAHPGGSARTFLWNPHFSVGADGWSTLVDYCRPLIDYFVARPELTLIMRPHFRVVRDFPRIGGDHAMAWSLLQQAAGLPNIELDRSADYLESFDRSDALLSDYSSLVTEYIQLDKPILRLGSGTEVLVNSDAGYFRAIASAESWSDIAAFLDECSRETTRHALAIQKLRQEWFPQQDGHSARRVADRVHDIIAEAHAPVGAGRLVVR